jgi:hypothetical protein
MSNKYLMLFVFLLAAAFAAGALVGTAGDHLPESGPAALLAKPPGEVVRLPAMPAPPTPPGMPEPPIQSGEKP